MHHVRPGHESQSPRQPVIRAVPWHLLQVMQSPDLAAGFDDPEVMRAVQDIGSNPGLMRTKYANNKKVQRFYAAMAGHVGQRLTTMGTSSKTS